MSILSVWPSQRQNMNTDSGVYMFYFVNDNTFGKTQDRHNLCPTCSLRNKNHKTA